MDYKRRILELLEMVAEDDVIFLRQIYTIIKKHIEKRKADKGLFFEKYMYLLKIFCRDFLFT